LNSYDTIKILHFLAVIVLIGPLVLTPKWLHLYRNDMGRKLLHELHLLTGIAGWTVLISGIVMLFLQNGEMLSFLWMQASLGLFIAIQLFDHFWADAREDRLENSLDSSTTALKTWLIIKLGLYTIIVVLMILKP
jgi:uncharacterized membrane protein